MQAPCQKCGKTITPEDFSAGRYYLFWITPTIPSLSLYLCQDCREISWQEQEALFLAWWERRESAPRTARPARKRRLRANDGKSTSQPSSPLAQMMFDLPR